MGSRGQCGPSCSFLQVGVGEVVGNPLAHALEEAVRSHGEGDIVELEITGGDYKPELVFKVPTDHPEVERLQGRYKTCAPLLTLSIQPSLVIPATSASVPE
jgi:hypothetical protein